MTRDNTCAIRPAIRDDIASVAALHAASWRLHYRGMLSDAYLDGPVESERLRVWTERLTHPRAGQVTLLAEDDSSLVGFVCVFLDHHRDFGSLIDNLHVAADRKGQGLGRFLMRSAGEAMLHAVPRRPAYLTVLEGNRPAQAFYDRIGGTASELYRETEADGSALLVRRYAWPNPAALIAGAT